MIGLLDANVLLALGWSNHVHHNAAHHWFATNAKRGWATCLFTQMGFLRLSLNPRIVGVSMNCDAALHLLQGLVQHPDHQYAVEGPPITAPPFDELVPLIVGYRQVSDAILLHLARAHQMQLITFDQAIAAITPWPANLEVLVP